MGKIAETRTIRNDHQKRFVKLMDSLCGSHSHWAIWKDFITMSAISIANTVDHDRDRAGKREKTYLTISGKYKPADMDVFAGMFAEVVLGMEETPDMDFLGELFMNMGLSSDANGQFFTPYHVCTAMAKMTSPHDCMKNGWMSVNDPACGAGATLVAFANECKREGINYQTDVLFTAQDIDMIVAMMCYIQLSLQGCAGYVLVGDTLSNPGTSYDKRGLFPVESDNTWFTPMYYSEVWETRRRIYIMENLLKQDMMPISEPQEEPPLVTDHQKGEPQEITLIPDAGEEQIAPKTVRLKRRAKQEEPEAVSVGEQLTFF